MRGVFWDDMAHFSSEQPRAVPIPVVMLALANAVLFGLGSGLHLGVEMVAVDEPETMTGAGLEMAATGLLAAGALGAAADAKWGRKVVGFANTFAIVAVAAVAMLLGLDDVRSSGLVKAMQVLRVAFATLSLLMLYHSGRRGTR